MLMIVLMIPRSRFFSSVLRFWNNFSDFNRGDVVPSRYFCVSILIRRHRDRHLSLERDEARASSCAQNGALDEEEDAALTMMIFVLSSFRKGHGKVRSRYLSRSSALSFDLSKKYLRLRI